MLILKLIFTENDDLRDFNFMDLKEYVSHIYENESLNGIIELITLENKSVYTSYV